MGREDSLQFSFRLLQNIAELAAVFRGLKVHQGGCGRTRKALLVRSFLAMRCLWAFLGDPNLKLRIYSSISFFSFLHSQTEYALFLQAR